MNETFTFNGVNSADHGVYISGAGTYNAPERVVEMIAVPGRNGAIAMDEGRFENINVTYPAFMAGTDQADFTDRLAAFRGAILSAIGYKRLEDDYHPDEFRLGVYRSGLEVEPKIYNRAGEFELTFDCKPQRFLKSGETAVTFTSSGTITNPTAFPAKSLLRVYGTGYFSVGEYWMNITANVSSGTYIDLETFEAYADNGGVISSRNEYVAIGNQEPELVPGTNQINLTSGITKIEITPRWWTI